MESPMKRPDVETLIAYAKGAVPPERARQIERFLAGDGEARRVIENFRRMQGLAAVSGEAPQRRRAGATSPARKPSGAIVAQPMTPPARSAKPKLAAALAASLAIVAAIGLGGFLLGREEESPIALGRLSS